MNRRNAKSRRPHALLTALAIAALGLSLHTASTVIAHPNQVVITQSAVDETKIPEGTVRARPGASVNIPMVDDPSKRISGEVVWYSLEKLSYIDKKTDTQVQTPWSELEPKRLPSFLSQLPDRRDAQGLLVAAEILINLEADEERVEFLLKYALRADDSVGDKVDALRDKMKGGGNVADPGAEADKPAGEADVPAGEGPAVEGNGGERRGDGQPDIDNPRAWPAMSAEDHAEVVKELQKSSDDVFKKMGHKMQMFETDRFIVYSDMSTKESKYWVGLLDKMYDKLCETFDLEKDKNIWRGKCLLMFFNSRNDFIRYNTAAYGNPASGAAGICYQFGTGDVHISMWKQDDEKELAHVLVHEAVHGFLFRYMSSHYVPNWLNEGLAEYIAENLVQSGMSVKGARDSRTFTKQNGRLYDFLTARNIQGIHYGLAYDLTSMMVQENRKGYVKMIQGLKEGLSTEESFSEKYGASVTKVINYYAKSRLRMDELLMH